MAKKTTMMMFLAMMVGGCFPMEDLPLEDDAEVPPVEEIDAAVPTPSPDAATTATPDAEPTEESDAGTTPECDAAPVPSPDAATPTPVDAGTPDATPETPDAAPAPSPDAAPETPDATLVTPDAACPACDDASDCDDGFAWTNDTCSAGDCVNTLTDCGGMRVRPSAAAVMCEFWGGFNSSEPATSLGLFAPMDLVVAASDGGGWKTSPMHSCSVICYDAGWARALLDVKIEWNGVTFVSAEVDGLTKGTFDGNNIEHP